MSPYSRQQREAHAEQHIGVMAALNELHLTSCYRICESYGIPDFLDDLKALRSKFRNELSFAEGK